MKKAGIYEILNTINGKVYVGSSADIYKRWSGHECDLKRGIHGNPHLQASYNKYGVGAFEYFMIEYCCPIKEMLLEKEQFWMDALKAIEKGYNLCPFAGSPGLGRKVSELVEFNGKVQCLKFWAEELGINTANLRERLEKWSIERALTTMNMQKRKETIGALHL